MPANIIRWEPPTYAPKSRIADGPWGRYLIERERPHARWFIAKLNGKRTSYGGETLEIAMASVERVIKSNHSEYHTP